MDAPDVVAFVNQCQAAIGHICLGRYESGAHLLEAALRDAPTPAGLPEQCVMLGVISDVLDGLRERGYWSGYIEYSELRALFAPRCGAAGGNRLALLGGLAAPQAGCSRAHALLASAALRHLHAHYPQPGLSLASTARALHASASHTSRVLRRCVGCGFRELLMRVRTERARELLRDSQRSIKEIAADVGYRSPSEFDHQFKRLCGVTPSEFRRARTGTGPPRTG